MFPVAQTGSRAGGRSAPVGPGWSGLLLELSTRAKPDAAELRRYQELAAERALAALLRVRKAAGLVEVGAGEGR